jgi:hypothetical protein
MFAALYESHPSTAAELVRGWAQARAEDAADLDRVFRAALNGATLAAAPELWLANDALMTGTSMFDQYRTLPRPHTFDVNAALPLDWQSVPGVTSDVAAALIADAPYHNLGQLLASPALSDAVRVRITRMSNAMAALTSASRDEESLSVWSVAMPYWLRIAAVVLAATAAAAWLVRRIGVRRWWPAWLISLAATLVVMTLTWVVTSPPWYPLAAPVVIGGSPWALWRLVRRRRAGAAAALGVWLVAAIPAWLFTRSW